MVVGRKSCIPFPSTTVGGRTPDGQCTSMRYVLPASGDELFIASRITRIRPFPAAPQSPLYRMLRKRQSPAAAKRTRPSYSCIVHPEFFRRPSSSKKRQLFRPHHRLAPADGSRRVLFLTYP
ncbi:hypothetical protein B296_00007765 [Ensete ventricosum]|uniref:Uncharacterized protein n=1 Tax=Ensete ventricosum TaxID=4639 RepID=A0A427AQ14_ENSVE|nr:hypothetical protein B296_00007765 [Ensete ventricosum]